MFEIRYEPGRMGLSDFATLKQVSVTIEGEPFERLLYHYRLAYSLAFTPPPPWFNACSKPRLSRCCQNFWASSTVSTC